METKWRGDGWAEVVIILGALGSLAISLRLLAAYAHAVPDCACVIAIDDWSVDDVSPTPFEIQIEVQPTGS